MKKKIIIIISVIVVISFAVYILQGSRFKKTNIFQPITTSKENNSSGNDNISSNDNNSDESVAQTAPNIEVKPADCDNDCKRFTKDDEKEYCQEICGTTSYFENAGDEGGSDEDCSDAKGIQKDYCLKDIAVGNKDFKICSEIKDVNIKKSCRNRLTEDMLESQENTTVEEGQ